MNNLEYLDKNRKILLKNINTFYGENTTRLVHAVHLISACYESGGKLIIMGNGGSAADAQHMAAELTGRLNKERPPVAAIAITTDSSALTAIGNDYGFKNVFKRQVEALVKPDDVIIAISTSGNSENILRACEAAGDCHIISLTGGTGGKLKEVSTINLNVSGAQNSSQAQEIHIHVIHTMIDMFDRRFK